MEPDAGRGVANADRGAMDGDSSSVRRFGIPLRHAGWIATLHTMPMHSFNDDSHRRRQSAPADRRQAEPEIIPPGADVSSRARAEAVFARRGIHIEVKRLGPLGIALILLGAGLLGAIALLMLLGAVLVGVAVAGVVLTVALVSRLLSGTLRP